MTTRLPAILTTCLIASNLFAQPAELRTGVANHAFDHLGGIPDQAEAATASGANIIYITGCGTLGYDGLPKPAVLAQASQTERAYLADARKRGVGLAIGYVCATSIVNLAAFDKNWSSEFRARFHTPVAEWRQQDRNGHFLPSWYGGAYQPACMNNLDWREYERFMVREQLEGGCDSIFFDNPTVHAQGCYCPACMKQFAKFLKEENRTSPPAADNPAALRDWADKHPADFMEFRGTIARDFIAEMRRYARTVKPGALITVNNSLNTPDVFFSQCRGMGYNIYEMSRTEDFVVVEDMATQPRMLANGQTIEYTPVYRSLHAISHGKSIVAVNLADADYHTAPHLVRLAMAEATANDASYLGWPTWPVEQRTRMAALIRPQSDFLHTNAALFQDSRVREDVVLFLPFRQWLVTDQCRACQLAADLARANVAFGVVCEDDLRTTLGKRGAKALLVESTSVFTPAELKLVETFKHAGGSVLVADQKDWLKTLQTTMGKPSVNVRGPSSVRAIVRDQSGKTIVHVLNLNVQKVNSFEDKVTSVADVGLTIRVPFKKVHSVRALTADADASVGALKFSSMRDGAESEVEVTLPRVDVATILVIE